MNASGKHSETLEISISLQQIEAVLGDNLLNDRDVQKKCGLEDSKHQNGIYVLSKRESKGENACYTGCKSEEAELEDPDEDIQLLVAPPGQPKSVILNEGDDEGENDFFHSRKNKATETHN
ncbi:hypothetical protein llap_2394 [Limosa lapponica baueri]|uniref:Uncharacterized protein n=1 Tax=Limosa lapponica baueri TaxID=1758121 RepID=A0A2I0UMM7_LIMLA|nr:hypothetical protein llap_2394 [Limosa lapponica baueri]